MLEAVGHHFAVFIRAVEAPVHNNRVLPMGVANAATGVRSLAPHAGGSIGYTHWENPIVVNGRLYCTDEDGEVVAYSL